MIVLVVKFSVEWSGVACLRKDFHRSGVLVVSSFLICESVLQQTNRKMYPIQHVVKIFEELCGNSLNPLSMTAIQPLPGTTGHLNLLNKPPDSRMLNFKDQLWKGEAVVRVSNALYTYLNLTAR